MSAPFNVAGGILLAGPAAVATGLIVHARWRAQLRPIWEERARVSWPAVRSAVEARHARALADYAQREQAASAQWVAADKQRVAGVRRLLLGDIDVIEQAVSCAIEAIDFPFEALCAVAVDDDDHALIDVDFLEIEDVVPETQLRALKSGAMSEKKRKVSERNELYAELVCGIAFAIAATSLSAAPTLTRVMVAGRTQRQKRASLYVEDDDVYEVEIPRSLFVDQNLGKLDPIDSLRRLTSRIQLTANGALKNIPAPGWAQAVSAAGELGSSPRSGSGSRG